MNWFRTFFFRKEPVEGIALFRIVFSILLILNALLLLPDLSNFFGERGVVEYWGPGKFQASNLYSFFKPTLANSTWILTLHLFSGVLLMLGLFTRTSAWVGFLTLSSLHHYNVLILNSGDTVLRLVLFYLGFSQAGKAYSLDRFLALRRGKASILPRLEMPWAQRLIQLQIAFLYFSTSFYKFDGKAWAYGEATYYTSRLWDFERFPVPYVFDHLWSIRATTWSSLIIEFSLGTLIWVKAFRIPVIVSGVLLHLGIEYSMNIPLFEWIMIALLIAMLEPRQGRALAQWLLGLASRRKRA
ncbi:MAG: HTTM domain-containing protein [Bdellovibrionales bacterium]|nr:HTTM domain-containing protein [Bdellovibrionales bacterium]